MNGSELGTLRFSRNLGHTFAVFPVMCFSAAIFAVSLSSWPLDDQGAPRSAFANPANQPNDPLYFDDTACEGQFGLFGFVPSCMSRLIGETVGLGIDRAWTLTRGRADVTIAVVAEGVDLGHPDLTEKLLLNEGELPGQVDRNKDGVLTLADLAGQPQLGDRNADGRIDVKDILLAYSDGLDNDDNGLVDDIAGWDFWDNDPDPSPDQGDVRGTSMALTAAAQTNNGLGGAGACPNCTVLAIRAAKGGRSLPNQVALSVLYAAHRASSVMAVETAVPGPTPYLSQSFRTAGQAAAVFISAGDTVRPSGIAALPVDAPGCVVVGRSGFETEPRSASFRDRPLSCARNPPDLRLASLGQTCANPQDAALLAGLGGLVVSTSTMRPTELMALLQSGPAEALELLQAARAGTRFPSVEWIAPDPSVPYDPTNRSFSVRIRVEGAVDWVLERRFGTLDWTEQASGTIGNPGGLIETLVSMDGLMPDPARPADRLVDHELSLRVRSRDGVVLGQRTVWLGTSLDIYPGFPLALGAGAYGSPRFADLDANGQTEIWVALLDGRMVAVDRSSQIYVNVDAQPRTGPIAPWTLPHLEAGVPKLGAPSIRRGPDGLVAGAVDARAVLTEWALGITTTTGQNGDLAHRSPNPVTVSRGATEAFVWAGPDGLRSHSPELIQPGPGVQGLALGQDLYLWAGSGWFQGLLTDALRVEVSNPIQPRGLDGFVPPSMLVLTQDGEERVFLPGSQGVARIESGSAISVAPPPYVPSLSSDSVGWIGFYSIGGEVGPRVFGQPIFEDLNLTGLDPTGTEVSVADVDGGQAELLFGQDGQRLVAISENGSAAVGWPKLTASPVFGPPAVGDFNSDGSTDVAAVTRDGWLFLWRTSGAVDGIRWAGAGHDEAASGNANRPILTNPADPEEDEGCTCSALETHGLGLIPSLVCFLYVCFRRRKG